MFVLAVLCCCCLYIFVFLVTVSGCQYHAVESLGILTRLPNAVFYPVTLGLGAVIGIGEYVGI